MALFPYSVVCEDDEGGQCGQQQSGCCMPVDFCCPQQGGRGGGCGM